MFALLHPQDPGAVKKEPAHRKKKKKTFSLEKETIGVDSVNLQWVIRYTARPHECPMCNNRKGIADP